MIAIHSAFTESGGAIVPHILPPVHTSVDYILPCKTSKSSFLWSFSLRFPGYISTVNRSQHLNNVD